MMTWLGRIAVVSSVVCFSLPVSAQTCTPLRVVEGEGTQTQVQKSVSPPSTGVTRSNWNTDFVVPSRQVFRRYVATITPENGGEYIIKMALKYNDDTEDDVYEQTVSLQEGKPLTIPGGSRLNATPFQVNLEIGGLQAVGKSYTVSVSGCN